MIPSFEQFKSTLRQGLVKKGTPVDALLLLDFQNDDCVRMPFDPRDKRDDAPDLKQTRKHCLQAHREASGWRWCIVSIKERGRFAQIFPIVGWPQEAGDATPDFDVFIEDLALLVRDILNVMSLPYYQENVFEVLANLNPILEFVETPNQIREHWDLQYSYTEFE